MNVVIYFLNGNDSEAESHYRQKEYRNDVIVEIDNLFYEVYFFVYDSLEYELTNDGFFSFPGIIILDEISNEKIYTAINKLIDYNYFTNFIGHKAFPVNKRFMDRWYLNTHNYKSENFSTYKLR